MIKTKNPKNLEVIDIEILKEDERKKILYVFNNTQTAYPRDKKIHQLFEEQVEATPNNIAVKFGEKLFTYSELNKRANQLAKVLSEKGVGEESIVAIMVPRSIESIIGILAILKAGGAYLPIDPGYPDERKLYMLEDSGAKILLTLSHLKPITGILLPDTLYLEDITLYQGDGTNIPHINRAENLAYVMYTSGSTGKPKGTMVEHRNVVRLVKNTNYIDFKKEDRILQTGAIVFDACTFEIWGALLNGLSLYLVDENTILDAKKLREALKEYKITILWLTSPLFNQLSEKNPEMFSELRVLLVGGDTLSPKHINNVMEQCPRLKVINGYGPTENTTFSTCFVIDEKPEGNIPIGRPISNSTAYIVDKYNQLLPIGVFGELWVGGDGVGRGYLKRKELTDEKFIDSPFVQGERIYKTGDLARWLPDGNIEFTGRIDNQVKIRGFRIELGEVEAQLMKHKDIKEVVVIAKTDRNNSKYLCAYLVSTRNLTMPELKEHILIQLPDYMVPSYFIRLDRMPLTQNGKIDKEQLPAPDISALNSGVEYIPPRNDKEEILAKIWGSVLGIDKLGIRDNFFTLGGDSLKAVEVIARASNNNINITVSDIFRHMTILDMMDAMGNNLQSEEAFDQFAAVQEMYNLKDYQCNLDSKGEDSLLTGKREEYSQSKELKVVIQRDITTYLHRSLPLCVVLAYDKYLPWYYSNFIQIFSFTDESGYVELNYLEPRDCCSEIVDMVCLGYHLLKREENIIDFIIEKINMGYYLIINVDEYYLPNKGDYKKNHFVHPSLIYGYDNKIEQLLGIGFDKGRLFSEITFDYSQFSEAYEEGKIHYKNYAPWCGWSAIQLMRPKSFEEEFPFSIDRFLKELKNYLFSIGDSIRMYSFEYNEKQVEFGFQVYDVLIRNLENLLQGKLTIDYRALHLLSEHKKCMYDRLGYVISKNKLSGRVTKLHTEYMKVVELSNEMRLKYLAQSFTRFDSGKLSQEQESMIKHVIKMVVELKNVEYTLLLEIYEQLKLDLNIDLL